MNLSGRGVLLPPERARPRLPLDSPGFVDHRAGVVLGVSCGVGGSESRNRRTPIPETNPGFPGTLSHLPGRESPGRRPAFQIPAARLGCRLRRSVRLRAENESAGRSLVGAEDTAGARSQRSTYVFTLPCQPFASEPWPSPPPHRDPITLFSYFPSFHRDCGGPDRR